MKIVNSPLAFIHESWRFMDLHGMFMDLHVFLIASTLMNALGLALFRLCPFGHPDHGPDMGLSMFPMDGHDIPIKRM